MLFTSIIYFLFLGAAVLFYYLIPARFRNYFLIAISALFYMYAKVEYIFIILFIIITNYLLAIRIEKTSDKRIQIFLFNLSVFINVGILIFFKYWNFLIGNFLDLLGMVRLESNINSDFLVEVALPLGLSYYIFQSIGYMADVFRGSVKAEISFSRFSLFTLFFPKLLVGPIERANHFLPQLGRSIHFDKQNINEGAKRIAWGLFKKLVVADRIAIYHNTVIASSENQSGSTLLLASVLYTFQVYADFSGYTDIALGTARMFGFDLMENFKRPLLSKSVSDFWRRWHISLSSWVNDYVFNPIVLKYRDWGVAGVFCGLVISFVVIGIWHGAAWNYVLFGLLQAFAIMYEFSTRKVRKRLLKKMPPSVTTPVSILLTFSFVTFSLIVFQSPTLGEALTIIKGIFLNQGDLFYHQPSTLLFMFIGCAIMMIVDIETEFRLFGYSSFSNKNWIIPQLSYALLLIYILLAGVFDGGQFIYFSF